jgi:hypothetical protein
MAECPLRNPDDELALLGSGPIILDAERADKVN